MRDDLAPPILALIDEVRAFPSRHRDSRDANGKLSYLGGADRLKLIADMSVVNVESGAILRIRDIPNPYSEEWLAQML